MQQLRHLADQPVDVDGLDFLRMLAREGEQALHQGRGAHRGLTDGAERSADAFVGRVVAAGGQFDIADDRGQQIVEVVRDAAGQPSDRFHLLRLAQRLFGGGRRAVSSRNCA